MNGRPYRKIYILFKRTVPARKWKQIVVDINDES